MEHTAPPQISGTQKQAAVSLQPYMLSALWLCQMDPTEDINRTGHTILWPPDLHRISQEWLSKPANTANMRTALFGRFTVVCLVGSR